MQRYTVKEIAERFGFSYSYLMKKLNEGKFQHHRISRRHVFFTNEDIEALEKKINNDYKVEAKK